MTPECPDCEHNNSEACPTCLGTGQVCVTCGSSCSRGSDYCDADLPY